MVDAHRLRCRTSEGFKFGSHAVVTRQMVDTSNAPVAYGTHPHVDLVKWASAPGEYYWMHWKEKPIRW